MKTEKLVWGLILVFIGGIFLLENFGVIDFYWSSIWRFWPLILIVIGVNMIFSRSDIAAGPYLSISLTILVLAFIGYEGMTNRDNAGWFHNFNHDVNIDWDKDDGRAENFLSEPWSGATRRAELNIRGGATSYSITDTTTNLVDARIRSSRNSYTLSSDTEDSVQVIDLDMNSKKHGTIQISGLDNNGAKIRLNSRPIWDISLNVGASESNFDLTPFKIRNLDLKGGVTSFTAKLGEPVDVMHVSANTGVSEFKLSVPKTAGCQIRTHSGLSARDFPGFNKLSDGNYSTSNFSSSTKKIIIELKGGLSDFEVSRY